MSVSRRLFIRDGVATVTLGLAAPSFLSAIAQAQGIPIARLVVVYLGGGNDALNTLISYQDAAYYSRRPSIAVPAGQVLQVGTDAAGHALGPASAARRPAEHLQRGASGARAAHRLSELEPLALRGHRHLGHGQPADRRPARAGSVAISIRCRGRSTRWPRGTPPARRRARCSRGRAACRRFRTRPPTPSRARTAARRRCRSGRPRRRWRRTRRRAGRIWRS